MSATDFDVDRPRRMMENQFTFDAIHRREEEDARREAERERWQLAIHESGHACTAIILGREFSCVWADATGGKTLGGSPATTAEEVNSDAAVSVGGGVAELLFALDLTAYPEDADWYAVARSLMSDGDHKAVRLSIEQFQAEHPDSEWQNPVALCFTALARPGAEQGVRAVAARLLDRGELTEAEVRRLVLAAMREAGG